MRELICIVCPKGCHLKVDEANDYQVSGNGCPRGAEYGKKECTHPTRTITSTICLNKGRYPRVSVKTSKDIAKELIPLIMERLNKLSVTAPVKRGDVVEKDICGSGADLVITKDEPVV